MHVITERPGDEPAISALLREAFRSHPHSAHIEHLIVEGLRRAQALAVSLVTEDRGRVVGHVALSPVEVGDGATGWFGLGPLAVEPARQGRGIGRALVEAGLAALCARGAAGCVLLGEPAYYGRFGFTQLPALTLPGVPPAYFLTLPFGAHHAQGEVAYHPAFSVTG